MDMADSDLAYPKPHQPQPASLLSLPNEIFDQIFIYSLIPDRIWVHVIRRGPLDHASQPLAALDYFVTDVGSQFCVQPFSLRRLMISRSLHAQLMASLWRTTVFNLGRISDADLLFTKASAHSCVHRMTHISIALENAGSILRPFDSYEQIIAPFRGHHLRSLRVVEIKVDFDAYARARLNDNELRRWLKHRDHMILLQCCLVALTLNFDPSFSKVIEPEAVPRLDSANALLSVEVRVPCLERDLGRQKLLDGELLNRFCKVEWVRTRFDRYGGPAGYLSVRQTSAKPRLCCDLLLRSIVLVALDDDAESHAIYRPVPEIPHVILEAGMRHLCFAHDYKRLGIEPGTVPALGLYGWNRMHRDHYIEEVCRVMNWLGISRNSIQTSLADLKEPGVMRAGGVRDDRMSTRQATDAVGLGINPGLAWYVSGGTN